MIFKNKIKYRKIDISKDAKAAKDCERHGCRGVPVILIGSRWICGFNEPVIKKELGIKWKFHVNVIYVFILKLLI